MKGFRKSLGLYIIEKLEDTSSDVTKKPVEDPASQAPAVDPASQAPAVDPASQAPAVDPASQAPAVDPVSQAPAVEDTSEFVEDTADVLEDTVDKIDVEPISSSITKPLEEITLPEINMSNIMLGVGVAIILGVIAFVIFRYVVPKPLTRYSLKYENSLADAVDAVDTINKFDVSVTNTSDFSFDTADVNAISPIEMIN